MKSMLFPTEKYCVYVHKYKQTLSSWSMGVCLSALSQST
nr:MAG TPA: hypothetical protein [Caudoviricetes sp.]